MSDKNADGQAGQEDLSQPSPYRAVDSITTDTTAPSGPACSAPDISEQQYLDEAVDEFAAAMKKRLHSKQKLNWTGWDGRGMMDEFYDRMLRNAAQALVKEDKQSLVDVANFAMMLRRFK